MIVDEILDGERFVAVDVGAANGIPLNWTRLTGAVDFYLFEPDEAACAKLAERIPARHAERFRCLPVALSGTGGRRTLHVTNTPTGSSLLPFDTRITAEYGDKPYLYPCREREVDTRTLADVFDELDEGRIDLIKLDTQGTELDILTGLDSPRFSAVQGIELEVGVPGIYRGQAQVSDVQPYLCDRGFELFDLRVARADRHYRGDYDHYRTRIFGQPAGGPTIASRVLEADLFFARNPYELIEAGNGAALRRLIVVYCTYNFFIEAYYVVGMAQSAGLFDAPRAAMLRAAVHGWHAQVKADADRGVPVSWSR